MNGGGEGEGTSGGGGKVTIGGEGGAIAGGEGSHWWQGIRGEGKRGGQQGWKWRWSRAKCGERPYCIETGYQGKGKWERPLATGCKQVEIKRVTALNSGSSSASS
ncbi:hypothetical protein Nepgr_005444 [Nepenthes gracilis]|uniref:Uncharacterized protein n=1 Tax=Nepenthes gracilis TaxID=150966 RepID=A0AAD3S3I1_NEPGR|nr:hypothetical protein Nepgr_005444 [Nepenthes gracilis]